MPTLGFNSLDFNVLGTILQKLTGANIFKEFALRIAKPTGIQDFMPGDGRCSYNAEGTNGNGDSKYPHYIFSMTAHNMARFGCLYLRNQKWNEQQVMPSEWVTRRAAPWPCTGGFTTFAPESCACTTLGLSASDRSTAISRSCRSRHVRLVLVQPEVGR
jgi:CubicO group peptidase (beta-lactamase class C family)